MNDTCYKHLIVISHKKAIIRKTNPDKGHKIDLLKLNIERLEALMQLRTIERDRERERRERAENRVKELEAGIID